jgi:hypothetical protein
VPGRLLAAVLAVFALALIWASSAAAASVTFDGEVLRYRGDAEPVALELRLESSTERPYLEFGAEFGGFLEETAFSLGPGCHGVGSDLVRVVQCPLISQLKPRYRFNLGSHAASFFWDLRGVVYGGRGDDYVWRGDRVYGGAGNDELAGVRLHGGPGEDGLEPKRISPSDDPVLYGGPARDLLYSPGRLYGGPGGDWLKEDDAKSPDMLVGGPGEDYVEVKRDGHNDVVRVRGGGSDIVLCYFPDPGDVLFVDRTDRLGPGCKDATVLNTGRPRYPYP